MLCHARRNRVSSFESSKHPCAFQSLCGYFINCSRCLLSTFRKSSSSCQHCKLTCSNVLSRPILHAAFAILFSPPYYYIFIQVLNFSYSLINLKALVMQEQITADENYLTECCWFILLSFPFDNWLNPTLYAIKNISCTSD